MGIDTSIYMKKEDVEKLLLENPFYLVEIYKKLSRRFYRVLEMLKMDTSNYEPLDNKKISTHLIVTEGIQKEVREFFAELLQYDIILAPDNWEPPKEVLENYVEINDLVYEIEELIKENADKLLKKLKENS